MEYEDLKKVREEVKKEQEDTPIQKITGTILALCVLAGFVFWVYMSFLVAFSGGGDDICTGAGGTTYYCGE